MMIGVKEIIFNVILVVKFERLIGPNSPKLLGISILEIKTKQV